MGHLYLREWIRAAMWFSIVLAASFVFVPADAVPETFSVSAMMDAYNAIPTYEALALVSLTVFSMLDAYTLARRPTIERVRNGDAQVRTCPSCGHDLEDDDLTFCPWCAERLEESS